MLPPGRPRSCSRSTGVRDLQARAPVRPAQQHVLDRLGQHRVQRPQRGGERRSFTRRASLSPRNSRAGRCSPNRVRVCASPAAQLGPEDRAVGEAVAVDLARRPGRAPRPAAAAAYASCSWLKRLVDVEGPGERGRGVDPLVAQPRQPRQQHVDLELRPLGCRLGVHRRGTGRGEQLVEEGGRDPDRTVAPCALRRRLSRRRARHVTSPSGSTATTSAPVHHLGPGGDGGTGEPVGDGAHAPDRDVPVAGPPADEVVEEADVLGAGTRPSRSAKVPMSASVATMPRTVSSANVARSVSPSGRSTSASPQLVVADQLADGVGGPQRLQDRREDPLGQGRHPPVEAGPGLVLGAGAGQRREGGRGRLLVLVVDQQPGRRSRPAAG